MAQKGKQTEEKLNVVPQEPTELIEDEKSLKETGTEKSLMGIKGAEDENKEEDANQSESVEIAPTEDDIDEASSNEVGGAKNESKEEDKEVEEEEEEEEEEAPPPAPPRPQSPVGKMKSELKEAFPNAEDNIITAILVASQGNMQNAFNALLYLSDPSVEPEISIAQPEPSPRPMKSSLTEDEMLARRLQKRFEKEEMRRRQRPRQKEREQGESDDDFAQLKETFSSGLEEARTTLNGWVSGLAKKLDGLGEQNEPNQQNNTKLFGALGGSSFNFNNRNTNRQGRNSGFDDDIQIISNDFHDHITLNDESTEDPAPTLPKRKSAEKQSDTYSNDEKKWTALSSDAHKNSDAFLVMDSDDEENKTQNS